MPGADSHGHQTVHDSHEHHRTYLIPTRQVPILGELMLSQRKDFNRPVLLAIYAPFLLVPAAIAVRMAGSSRPFDARTKAKAT